MPTAFQTPLPTNPTFTPGAQSVTKTVATKSSPSAAQAAANANSNAIAAETNAALKAGKTVNLSKVTNASGVDANTYQTTPAPTVITNADLGHTITSNTNKLATANTTGTTIDGNGNHVNANGTLVTPVTGADTSSDTPTFGIDTGKSPTGGTKQYSDSTGNVYTVDSNGEIVAGGGGQYQVGANIAQYPDLYKTVTGQDVQKVGGTVGGSGDPATDALLKQMDDITARGDARTASSIQDIKDKYAGLVSQQEEINRQQTAGVTQSLLLNNSSRYAQASSPGISASVMSAGLDKIKGYLSEESDLINKANDAQDSADYKTVQDKLAEYDKVKAARQAETDKLNAAVNTAAKAANDAKAQAAKDNEIATVFSSGITDPAAILKELQAKGYTDVSAKDIGDSIKNLALGAGIDTTGLQGSVKEYYTLVNEGLPIPPSVAALPKAQQPFAYAKYMHDLTVNTKTAAAKKVAPYVTLTTPQKEEGLGVGFTQSQLDGMLSGATQYGWPEVIKTEGPKMTPEQQAYITKLAAGQITKSKTTATSTSATDFSGL